MSDKSRERRQKAIERGVYQKKQGHSPPSEAPKKLIDPVIFHDPPSTGKVREMANPSSGSGPPTGDPPQELIIPVIFHGPPSSSKDMETTDPTPSSGPPTGDPPKVLINPVTFHDPPEQPANNWGIPSLSELVVPDHPQDISPGEKLYDFVTSAKDPDQISTPPEQQRIAQPTSDTHESILMQKADANRKAMQDALTPHLPDGTLIDHLEPGQWVRAKLPSFQIPETLPPGSLYNPVADASEFEDGKLPHDLSYVDGFVTSRKLPNGQLCFEAKYDDPVLNLSDEQRNALELGLKTMRSSSGKQKASASKGPEVLPHSADPVGIIDNPQDGCMYYGGKRGSYKVSNFRIRAVESRLVIGKLESDAPRTEYLLEVICGSVSKTISLTPDELDIAVKLIQKEMPCCIVFPEVQKANALISNHIREQLSSIPQKTYVQRTGFLKLGSRWVYVHDGATPSDPNTVFDTGRYIPDDRRVSDVQAFHNAMGFLDISGKDELILPLFLLAHLGPMFQLFHEAGRTPRFVTVLAGRSGSLKTSMSLILYRLFQDQGRTPTASFRDTEVAMELKLGTLNGSVGIFDDLRPPVSDLKAKANIEKFESLIRAVGDHTAKSRSNTKLGRAKEFIPSGCCLVTAEDLSGSQSSLLRCLVLSISKGDIDGAKLRYYQNNPDLITTHMSRFLTWIGANANDLISALVSVYPSESFENDVTELRLVDTATILWVVGIFLSLYAQQIGAMTPDQVEPFQDRCYNAICSAVIASEAMSKEANPCAMYLTAFFDLWDHGEIRLAESMSLYCSGGCDGYLSDGCAWIDAHAVYAKVRQYYNRLNTIFPLTENQLAVHMADAELIDVQYETRNGAPKRLFTRKSSLPSRKRMQVLHLDRAYAYLEEQAN